MRRLQKLEAMLAGLSMGVSIFFSFKIRLVVLSAYTKGLG